MKSHRREIILFTFALFLMLFFRLSITAVAQAASAYTIASDGTGCSAVGTWNASTSTCTLNRDISVSGTGGISLTGSNFTLDGAGYTVTGDMTPLEWGIDVAGATHTGVDVINLRVRDFYWGIRITGGGSDNVAGNDVSDCSAGIVTSLSTGSNQIYLNTMSNSGIGLRIFSTNSNLITLNSFLGNTTQAVVEGASSGNTFDSVFGGNYWSDFDTWDEGCQNSTFDFYCDGAYTMIGGSVGGKDTKPFVLRNLWSRFDWTWYDNVFADNWVLLANRPIPISGITYDLEIAGVLQPLAGAGQAPGFVNPGAVIYNKYEGIVDGPVTAFHTALFTAIASQRTLWPKGGNSLEEVVGVPFPDSTYYWPWYDMFSEGYKNWILISNPNDFQVHYQIVIAGVPRSSGVIPAHGRVTPDFPGLVGGPVIVSATNDHGEEAYIFASQRVLSNAGTAFNEVPGQRRSELSNYYVWTWYDMTGDARNWVLVANPGAAPIFYEVWIGGDKVMDGGPIPTNGNETPTFPGKIDGPVEVKCFSNAAHSIDADCIASQRSVWGPSFEEVLGKPISGGIISIGGSELDWTWYDQVSSGSQNWVLVATLPGETDTVTVEVSFVDQPTNTIVTQTHDITPAEKRWTPTFPGKIGGPVHVKAYKQGDPGVDKDIIASQRVLWNGYFNEVWGQ